MFVNIFFNAEDSQSLQRVALSSTLKRDPASTFSCRFFNCVWKRIVWNSLDFATVVCNIIIDIHSSIVNTTVGVETAEIKLSKVQKMTYCRGGSMASSWLVVLGGQKGAKREGGGKKSWRHGVRTHDVRIRTRSVDHSVNWVPVWKWSRLGVLRSDFIYTKNFHGGRCDWKWRFSQGKIGFGMVQKFWLRKFSRFSIHLFWGAMLMKWSIFKW